MLMNVRRGGFDWTAMILAVVISSAIKSLIQARGPTSQSVWVRGVAPNLFAGVSYLVLYYILSGARTMRRRRPRVTTLRNGATLTGDSALAVALRRIRHAKEVGTGHDRLGTPGPAGTIIADSDRPEAPLFVCEGGNIYSFRSLEELLSDTDLKTLQGRGAEIYDSAGRAIIVEVEWRARGEPYAARYVGLSEQKPTAWTGLYVQLSRFLRGQRAGNLEGMALSDLVRRFITFSDDQRS